jgi:type II secretory pathway pseudopilin PulG
MVEVIVALAVITTLMAALGTYFVSSQRVSRKEAQVQAATRIAQAGMEYARGFGGPTLLAGRQQCGNCDNLAPYDVWGYLSNTLRWDAPVTGVTPTLPLPRFADAEQVRLNNVTYYRFYFVGRCWQAATGGLCGTNTTLPVPMVRLNVGVMWSEAKCPAGMCIRVASALFSADPSDPVYTR